MSDEFTTEMYDSDTITTSDVPAVKGSDAAVTGGFYPEYEHTSRLEHALAVTFFATVGLFGNALTIHIYRTRITKGGSTYIKALAIVDIIALCTILPMNPFMEWMRNDSALMFNIYVILSSCTALGYLWILLAMTIERLVAVFKPFKIKQLKKPIQRSILALSMSHLVLQVFHFFSLTFYLSDAVSTVVYTIDQAMAVLTISAILLAYPAIIYKLLSHGSTMSKFGAKKKNRRRQQAKTGADDNGHADNRVTNTEDKTRYCLLLVMFLVRLQF